jgi:VanZ family protein
MMGGVLHRHPFLGLLTVLYLGFVGLVTLTPGSDSPDYSDLAARVLARLQRYPDLDPLTVHLSVARIEFLANIGLFVPLGVFLLLLVGTRLWFVALMAGIVLTSMIESVQKEIPGRVSDPRDVAANSIGMFVGIALAVLLTLPATLRRNRERG